MFNENSVKILQKVPSYFLQKYPRSFSYLLAFMLDNLAKNLLAEAAFEGDIENFKHYFSQVSDVNFNNPENGQSILYIASQEGHDQIVNFLLLDGRVNFTETDRIRGLAPIHIASENGHINVVKALLEKGEDINRSDITGRKPIELAIEYDQVDLVRFLIEQNQELELNYLAQYAAAHNLDHIKDFISSINRPSSQDVDPIKITNLLNPEKLHKRY